MAPRRKKRIPLPCPERPVQRPREPACLPIEIRDPAREGGAGRNGDEEERDLGSGAYRSRAQPDGDAPDRKAEAEEKAERRLVAGLGELDPPGAPRSAVGADGGKKRRPDAASKRGARDLEMNDLQEIAPDRAGRETFGRRPFGPGGEESLGVGREGVTKISRLHREVAFPGGADREKARRGGHPGPSVSRFRAGWPGDRTADDFARRGRHPVESAPGVATESQLMEKKSVGRPRDGDPAETRRGILEAAEVCFASAGFAGATTRQVASRAGVNVATLHYHFGNKEGLYRAVLGRAASGSLPVADGAGAPAERFSRLIGQLWDFGVSRPSLARLSLLDRLAGPAPAGTEAPEEDARVALLRRTLGTAANSVPPRGLPPAEAARMIVTLLDGSIVALCAGTNGPAQAEGASSAPREAVVAAALRLAGFVR